jgi:two-component system KDP operon response regulator KdpE
MRPDEMPTSKSLFVLQNLRVDLSQRQVFVDDEEVHLTPIEYKLLTVLIRHAGKVIPTASF